MDPQCGLRRIAASATCTVAALAAVLLASAAPAAADSIRDEQWQLRALDVTAAWRYAAGAGVIVAVLDSGVDANHPDLAGQVLPGLDLVDGSTRDGRADPVGHGTTVAALIAGRNDDNDGVVGLAPQAMILPVRVLDSENKYDDAAVVARGLRWAVDQGASVVNLSLGGDARSDDMADALRYAEAHDVVVIACTGNSGVHASSSQVWYPARESGVVAVAGLSSGAGTGAGSAAATTGAEAAGAGAGAAAGATERGGTAGARDLLWSGSLTGPETVLTAPAVNLLGARPGGYWRVQGTSFAAPLVAATAALIRSRWPDMSAANVINRLVRTARDLGPIGRDDRYGYGEVDPVAALTSPVRPVIENPLIVAPDQRDPERGQPGPDAVEQPAPIGNDATAPVVGARRPAAHPAASRPRTPPVARRLAYSLIAGTGVFGSLLLAGLYLVRLRRTSRYRSPGSGWPRRWRPVPPRLP